MRAIKAFDSQLCATQGKGIMQYEFGKTYKEAEAKCAHKWFSLCRKSFVRPWVL